MNREEFLNKLESTLYDANLTLHMTSKKKEFSKICKFSHFDTRNYEYTEYKSRLIIEQLFKSLEMLEEVVMNKLIIEMSDSMNFESFYDATEKFSCDSDCDYCLDDNHTCGGTE